jgi:hypothetical protein
MIAAAIGDWPSRRAYHEVEAPGTCHGIKRHLRRSASWNAEEKQWFILQHEECC